MNRPAFDTGAAVAVRRAGDFEVMSLVGFAHGTSHFFHLVIPSLFPWLMAEFGLSFTRAGTLTTACFSVSGVGQALAGVAVDRYGAQRVLAAGIALLTLSALTLSAANSYPALLAAAVLAGAGNAVFHPADFTVLNRSVSPARLAHAFSAHGVAGNIGWAAAPVCMAAIATAAGWRFAAVAAASLGIVALGCAALLALSLASGAVPATAVTPLMAVFGFFTGTATPSRDLLVRRAAMERFGQRSFGRIYGFVYSGLDAGLSVAPILLGPLLDRGMFSAVLYAVALFQG